MNKDDTIYIIILILLIPIGYAFKDLKSVKLKSTCSSVIGFLIVCIVCYKDALHSLFVVAVNCGLIKAIHPKYLPIFSFIFNFGYLLFFRLTFLFGLPPPLPYANAVQLVLTLKIVGLAFEISDSYKRKLKLQTLKDDIKKIEEIEKLKLEIEFLSLKPNIGIAEVFSYCYCYVGILTGPYFKYRTYTDWLQFKDGHKIDTFTLIAKRGRAAPFFIIGFLVLSKFISFKDATKDEFYENALWYRLVYMVLIFYLFRFRFYIAWIFAEISCITATFGAYPIQSNSKPGAGPTDLKELKNSQQSKSHEYNFNCINNIDEIGCEIAPTVKQVLHHWNMTVQYWMAAFVYKRVPYRAIGQPLTMFVSAYWHGVHPGYFLSMLTTTPCIIAENMMNKGLKSRLHERYHKYYDFCTWIYRTREFDYMSMGFILLHLDVTIRFWKSVYFIGHFISLFFIILGYMLIKLNNNNKNSKEKSEVEKKVD